MKPVEIFLRRRGRLRRRTMEWVNIRYFLSAYVNVTVYPPVQLLCANKIILKNENKL
jgi:hypothetical protein